jgi:MoaA/NifB/PqqE/SkfB family radical SAM enzyme
VDFDNANQTARIRSRWRAYATIATHALRRGVSPIGLLVTKYPYAFPTRRRPASLSVEITDACNLKCDYCVNPTFAYPRTYMSDEAFEAIVADLTRFPVDRIRVCGGEPTLHPSFARFAEGFAARSKFLSVVTNAQWKNLEIVDDLLRWFDLIEVSVDAGGSSQYERARAGASFERLQRNLELLHRRRAETRSPATINIRLMVRPSTDASVDREREHWAVLSDSVMVQYVIDQRADGSSSDVFVPVQLQQRTIPRCTMPFKDLAVRSDGTVPVCHVNGSSLDPNERILLGHVVTHSLSDMWSGATLDAVRTAHRTRDTSALEFCRGCSGR